MSLITTAVNSRRMILCMMTGMLLATTIAAQQNAKLNGWQTYSPDGASFSMRVPRVPLPAQGHIFNSAYEERAYRLIEHGSRSRIYNFEIEKDGKRRFLVSILEVQTTKERPHRFIIDSEVELINATIGDDIVHSRVARTAIEDGEVSQWSYKKKGGLGDDDEDDGIVYVRRWCTCMVIVVVDYDYAKAGDVEVKAMLDSLRVR